MSLPIEAGFEAVTTTVAAPNLLWQQLL
eukprot:COSAG03_NODE_25213_length_267_cov_0.607143_1_plen_27_part_10